MDYDPPMRAQATMLAWVLACFAGMAVIGILASAAVFVAAFVRFRGGRPLVTAIAVGVAVFAFQYAIFEWLLDYELYRGLLFTRGGMSAW
jgi:hypothetical protein